jgi:lysophospholipase L1-like esterase
VKDALARPTGAGPALRLATIGSLRWSFALGGIVAIAAGLCVTTEFLAAHLSADGEITEVAYAHALRLLVVGCGLGAVVVAARARAETLQNSALAITTLATACLLLEGGLRLAERMRTGSGRVAVGLRPSAVPDLVYENTPGFEEDGERKFNSLGMRDDERVFSAAVPKIVVVGDSIEAWRALPVDALYPRLLQASLTARGTPFDVVNLGVTGYSLHQKVAMLRHRGLAWRPRLVVVGYCLNDPIPASEILNHFAGREPQRPWRIVELVSQGLRSALGHFGIDFYTEIHRPDGAAWHGVVADLEDLGGIARDNHVPVVLLIFPLMAQTAVEYPWGAIHDRVARAARADGLVVVDLLARFEAAGFANVREDTVHPGAQGHRIAAEALVAEIAARGLLPAGDGEAR